MSIKSLLQLILFLLIILIIGGIYYVYFFSKNQSDTINLDTNIYKIEDKIDQNNALIDQEVLENNKINQNVNRILNNVILKKDDLQNKIYFKNLLNDALKSYAG